MKKWMRANIVLVAIMLVGLIAASVIVIGRGAAENQGHSFDIVLDYADLEQMAKQSDEDIDFWLDYFRSTGIDKIALSEKSIKTFADRGKGEVYLTYSSVLMSRYGWDQFYPKKFVEWILSSDKKNDAVVVVTNPELYDFFIEGLRTRGGEEMTMKHIRANGVGYIWIHGEGRIDGMTWATMPLGLEKSVADNIESHGFTLIPRTAVVKGTNTKAFGDAVLSAFREYDSPYMIDGGASIVGYDDNPDALTDLSSYLNETGTVYCVIERSDQSLNLQTEGMDELVPQSGYDAVRVLTMWPYIQTSFAKYNYEGPEEIVNTLYRAVYERNCRIIFLKMIIDPETLSDYITEPEQYSALVGGLISRMGSLGYRFETVRPIDPYQPSVLLRILVGFGAISAAVALAGVIFPLSTKVKIIAAAAGCILVAGAFLIAPNASKLVLSMGAGIAYPSLAAALLCRILHEKNDGDGITLRTILPYSIVSALGAAALCLVGGLSSAAALSEIGFMLEMELYRGVKFMQLAPLVIFVIFYLLLFFWEKRFGTLSGGDRNARKAELHELRGKIVDTMDKTIKVRGVVIAAGVIALVAVLAGVGSYYLQRTGNSDNVSTLELIFRNFLENTLTVRPRTKEFLIGWPCAMLFVWAVRRRVPVIRFIFGIGAVVGGYVGVVNTFLHIRTSVVLSLIRVGTGFIIGIAVGTVFVLIADLIYRKIAKRRARKING